MDPRTMALLTSRLEVSLDPSAPLPSLRPSFGDSISTEDMTKILIEMTDIAGGALIALGREQEMSVWGLLTIIAAV